MNKLNHLKRTVFQSCLSLGIALFSLTSVAYGTSSTVNKAIDNEKQPISTLSTCEAAFYNEAFQSTLPTPGAVTFHNFSEGDYTALTWDFGDGSVSSDDAETLTHYYEESGTYLVTLTIWNANYDCHSTASQEISVSTTTDPCMLSGCVYPGDANNDGRANLDDLMSIGIGFGTTGPARVDPEPMEWTGQEATDWDQTTATGVNYKHFDSDGNGIIDYQDMMPLLYHYTPMDYGLEYTSSNHPKVSLDFEVDTVFIEDDTESILTLSAGVVLGSNDNQLEDIYGMSLYFDYDSTLTEVTEGVVVDYNDNCFFGGQSDVIAYGQELRPYRQADMAITRLNGQNISGHGRVATVNFIIIIDVVDGRSEKEVSFDVPITGVKVIDKDGNIIPVSVDSKPAKVIFVKQTPTSTKENPLNSQVLVFPNPVSDQINIELTDLTGEYVQIYNSLGQLVRTHQFNQTATSIPANDLTKGIYILNIQTDQGMVNKRIVVE